MVYPGEHLLPGQLGHFFVVLALVSSLVASVCFFISANTSNIQLAASWKKLGRISFVTNGFSLFSIFGCLLYIVASHKFEYYYAWDHSSKSLDYRYLLSCIWEGQQGSFLLWTLWHAVIGFVLMRTAKQWEAPVMSVISVLQFGIATMILGIYFFGVNVGNGPFLLTREFYIDAPFASHPDYMSLPSMQDGQGLNQLLQNYWMVIHPPILFLGFASTVVPFAYAIAGLWKKSYTSWTRAAVPWTLFSACVLGTGIMMGAAWAYESLTFGGYWAWDPVENASLVPWLIMIAGLHTLVIYNATGNSLRATYLFFILSFIFILYSTYLTRSGDLTDTSVHAFTGSGLNWQLRIFTLAFLVPSIVLFAIRYKKIPFIVKEESTHSREFWMFIGSLVFFLSAMFIITATSLPVINKIFGTNFVIGSDPEFAYNRIQIFVACVIGFLTAMTQYLKYRDTARKFFISRVWPPTAIALVISLLISIFGNIDYNKYGIGYLGAIHLAIFAAVYSVVANTSYIWVGLNGKMKAAGGSIAHIGFGLMLVGILISSSKKSVLSYNTTGINLRFDPASKENASENLTLFKTVTTDMGKYDATYVNSDSTNEYGNILYFRIDMKKKGSDEAFSLYPNLIKNTKGQEKYSNNPDSKHYWNKDIFSYISAADNMDEQSDTSQFTSYSMNILDTIFYSNGFVILNKIVPNPNNDKYHFTASDTALMADLTVVTKEGLKYPAMPMFYVKNNQAAYIVDTVFAQNLAVGFSRILDDKRVEIQLKESNNMVPYVALKVYEFPYINVLWLGTFVMIFGFGMSMWRRIRLSKVLKTAV